MQIYVVARGDTLFSISNAFSVTEQQLIYYNGIDPSLSLVVGQALIIPDTAVPDRAALMSVGYAYVFTPLSTLRPAMDSLSYISPFAYGISAGGELLAPDDEEIISFADSYAVPRIMVLTTIDESGKFNSENLSRILSDTLAGGAFIERTVQTAIDKGYVAVDCDVEFIPVELREEYQSFLSSLADALHSVGKLLFIALAPKVSDDQSGVLYEAHDYAALGAIADRSLMMTYEWGFAYSEPMAVAPIDKVTRVVDYGLSRIPREKLLMGIPNYGYDWTLPFVKGTRALTISNEQAISLAAQFNAEIRYDEVAQTPFFNYVDYDGTAHEVWFEDARSFTAKLDLCSQKALSGVGIWNISKLSTQLYTLINYRYNVTGGRI